MIKFLSLIVLAVILMTGSVLADADKIKIKGDFRYRHEIIDQEDKDVRHRERIRARVAIEGKVNEEAKIVVGLSSGSDDPVSTNQTLTGSFTSKTLWLDLAYFEIKPKAVKGLKVLGGKMKNPFYFPGKSELIWDGDMRPEGLKAQFTHKTEKISFNLIGSGLWIEERKAGDDTYLAGGQGFFTYNLEEKKGDITVGGSFFKYGNIKGFEYLYDDDTFGNSEGVDTLVTGTDTTFTDIYAEDYELLEIFGQVTYKFDNIPVKLIGDFVTNTAADSLNSGWLVGVYVGKTKKPGSWSLKYLYRNLEQDAVFGLYTNSDFGGGGTDAKGHEIGGSYQLMDNTTIGMTYLNNQIGLEEDDMTDYQRWQFDLKFKF